MKFASLTLAYFDATNIRIRQPRAPVSIEFAGPGPIFLSDKIPFRISPMLATLVDKSFHLPGWIYEEKYDGVRILAYKEGSHISLITRNGIVRTDRYPEVGAAVCKLKPRFLLLDGEAVVFDKHNVSHFQLLQQGEGPVKYAAFDCLYLNGKDLRSAPLRERRKTLKELLHGGGPGTIVLSEELAANGLKAFEVAKKRKLEGLVAKNLESKYVEKRSREWLKVKVNRESEFAIGGYTKPGGSRQYLGALLLGVYEGNKLRYAGKVGTGFDTETLRTLSEKLKKLKQEKSPFADEVRKKNATFVRPKLVAQIAYTEWTKDGRLRHPAFLGLRDDKAPHEVRKEEA
jgi:bifunctional non-homologous end joining protein LigD